MCAYKYVVRAQYVDQIHMCKQTDAAPCCQNDMNDNTVFHLLIIQTALYTNILQIVKCITGY